MKRSAWIGDRGKMEQVASLLGCPLHGKNAMKCCVKLKGLRLDPELFWQLGLQDSPLPSMVPKEVMMTSIISRVRLETVKAKPKVKVRMVKEKEKAKETASSRPAGSSKNMESASTVRTVALAMTQKIRDEPRQER